MEKYLYQSIYQVGDIIKNGNKSYKLVSISPFKVKRYFWWNKAWDMVWEGEDDEF
jgi:hypothetical protein